jgi:signal transduction histidine kinase
LQVYTNGVILGGRAYTTDAILWYALPVWWVWVPLTPLILTLGRRFRIERSRWGRSLLVHIPTSLVVALLHLLFYAFWINVAAPYEAPPRPLLERTASLISDVWLHVDLLAYWAILGGSFALDYYRKFRERELRASRLEARLAEAHLHALKMQLHPHFLFNTLNAISTLILKHDHDAAVRMLTRLSDFLRTTLDEPGRQVVPLDQELAFTEQYLAIEQCRFQDRLQVVVDVEPDVLSAQVPSLILQPLVENAIRHGIAPQEAGGRLVVRVQRCDKRLRLSVQDDGPGLPEGGTRREHGIGLANTQARLEQLYGDDHHVTMEPGPEGGLCVTLDVPFRTEPTPASSETANATQ